MDVFPSPEFSTPPCFSLILFLLVISDFMFPRCVWKRIAHERKNGGRGQDTAFNRRASLNFIFS